MSTIPSRVKNINDILGNINNQTLKPDKIFLNIPLVYNRFKNEVITEKDLKHINRENIEKPAGRLDSVNRELDIQMKSKLSSINEFKKIAIKNYDGLNVKLEDISRIEIGPETERGFLRANGENAIGLGIVRQTKSNVLKVADAVKQELALIKPTLPQNIKLLF